VTETPLVVGIDLGTTNSLVGAVEEGQPRLFADERGDPLLPSAVGCDERGRLLVGREARNRRLLDPGGTVLSVKRRMGEDVTLPIGRRPLSPPQISALILGALLDRVEGAVGRRPDRAVITVPAFFDDRQRQATRDAGELAGLRVERLVNEPTAAALCFQTGQEELALVYDFGGGTFDVSILERDAGLLEVRTSRGDTHLGGDDLDRALLEHVLGELGPGGARLAADPRAMTRLLDAVERAKIALSEHEEVRLAEPFLGEHAGAPVHLDLTLSRATLERLAGPFIERTLACIDVALRDARVGARDLDRVMLVGGTSRMPLVQRRVAEHLGRPVTLDAEPERSVALGATRLAGRAAGLPIEEVLVDITPHTLAAGAAEHPGRALTDVGELRAVPIIPRDTVVPVVRTQTLYTIVPDQDAVLLPIVQGEHPKVGQNTWLGEVAVTELPPGPANSPVEVRFSLDLSGVLEVEAVHLASGRRATVRIEKSPHRLSELRRRRAREEVDALRSAADGTHPEPAAAELSPGEAAAGGAGSRPAAIAVEPVAPAASPEGAAAPTAAQLERARGLLARADRELDEHGATLPPALAARLRAAAGELRDAVERAEASVAARTDALADALLDLL